MIFETISLSGNKSFFWTFTLYMESSPGWQVKLCVTTQLLIAYLQCRMKTHQALCFANKPEHNINSRGVPYIGA